MQGLGLPLVEAPLCLLRLSIEVCCNTLLSLFDYLIHHNHESNSANKLLKAFKKHFCNHIKGFCPQTFLVHCEGVCVAEWLTP